MASVEKIQEAMNYIRSTASQDYQARVPAVASTDSIDKIGFILQEQDLTTQFINGLVNRIIKTMVERKTFKNPLGIFKKGTNPLGTDIQHMFTNPAIGKQYELSEAAMQKLLSYNQSDDKIVYYRRNRRDLYEVSVAEDELRAAFVSWEKLGEFIDGKVLSLTNGNEIDEYAYTKNMLSKAVTNSTIRKQLVTMPTDNETAKDFVKLVKKAFGKFKFPRSDYNSYGILFPNETPVTTFSNKERICLITTTDALAEVDVELLAQAFNMSKAELDGRIVEVDEFQNSDLVAVLCDEAFLQIYDNMFKFRNFYNARALVYNYYVHAWSTYALSPFANALAFVTSNDTVQATGVYVQSTELNLKVGDNIGIVASVLPANATDKGITFESSDPAVAEVNTKGFITALKAGVANITVKSNVEEATTETIAITVS